MSEAQTFTRTCPECSSGNYVFRGRKFTEPEPGKQVAETTYLCRDCEHKWKDKSTVTDFS